MANARLGSYLFDVNPNSINWGYSMYVRSFETYGGRVVQILNVKVDDIVVTGQIPQGRGGQFEAMERVESQIHALMQKQIDDRKPIRFSMPALGIEGNVYIRSYGDIKYDYSMVAPTYTLTLAVDTGFGSVTDAARNAAVVSAFSNAPKGVGLVRSQYRTPQSSNWKTVLSVMQQLYKDESVYDSDSFLALYEALAVAAEGKEGDWEGPNISDTIDKILAKDSASYLYSLGVGSGQGLQDMTWEQFFMGYLTTLAQEQNPDDAIVEITGVHQVYRYSDGTYTLDLRGRRRYNQYSSEDGKTFATYDDVTIEKSVIEDVYAMWGYYEYLTHGTSGVMDYIDTHGVDVDNLFQPLGVTPIDRTKLSEVKDEMDAAYQDAVDAGLYMRAYL